MHEMLHRSPTKRGTTAEEAMQVRVDGPARALAPEGLVQQSPVRPLGSPRAASEPPSHESRATTSNPDPQPPREAAPPPPGPTASVQKSSYPPSVGGRRRNSSAKPSARNAALR